MTFDEQTAAITFLLFGCGGAWLLVASLTDDRLLRFLGATAGTMSLGMCVVYLARAAGVLL